jgi:hypothetical protein
MKTLFSLVCVLALTTGAIALDAYRLDAADLFCATAVAALFAFALNDGRVRRPLVIAPVTRLPAARRTHEPQRADSVNAAA